MTGVLYVDSIDPYLPGPDCGLPAPGCLTDCTRPERVWVPADKLPTVPLDVPVGVNCMELDGEWRHEPGECDDCQPRPLVVGDRVQLVTDCEACGFRPMTVGSATVTEIVFEVDTAKFHVRLADVSPVEDER